MKKSSRKLAGMLTIGMFGFMAMEVFAATANLKWKAPTQRENGATLAASEIAGYEIQYKSAGDSTYKVLTVSGTATSVSIPNLPASNSGAALPSYEFRIMVTDTAGMSSGFVQLTPLLHNPPKGVSAGTFMIVP